MTTVSQAPGRRGLLTETWLVLGVSLGASAIWSILRIIERLTREVALGQQTSALNSSVTPDRPWLDLAYQLVGVALGVIPAFLALHLLTTRPGPGAHGEPAAYRIVGFDLRKPVQDLLRGAGLATVIGVPGLGLYAAAKAWLHAVQRSWVKEYSPQGIRFNTIAPGTIETEFHADKDDAWRQSVAAGIPLRRLGQCADLVPAYLFLSSHRCSGYITGHVLDVNGGQWLS